MNHSGPAKQILVDDSEPKQRVRIEGAPVLRVLPDAAHALP
jgi:hypothetical protein